MVLTIVLAGSPRRRSMAVRFQGNPLFEHFPLILGGLLCILG